MKAKKSIAILVIVLVCLLNAALIQAQPQRSDFMVLEDETGYYNSMNLVEDLKQTTTLVIIKDEESEMSQTLIKAFDKFWKFSKYMFVTFDEAEKCFKNDTCSFVFLDVITKKTVQKKIVEIPITLYDYSFRIYFGHSGIFIRSNFITPFHQASLAYRFCFMSRKKPLTLSEREEKLVGMEIPILIKYLGNSKTYKKPKFGREKLNDLLKVFWINKGKEEFKGKTILLPEGADSKEANDFAKGFNMSPDSIKIVSYEEIEKAIADEDKNVVIAFETLNKEKKDKDADKTYGPYNLWTTDGNRIAYVLIKK